LEDFASELKWKCQYTYCPQRWTVQHQKENCTIRGREWSCASANGNLGTVIRSSSLTKWRLADWCFELWVLFNLNSKHGTCLCTILAVDVYFTSLAIMVQVKVEFVSCLSLHNYWRCYCIPVVQR
jgi:hypothetical protein